MPIIPDRAVGGSTDVGDVSWNTPTVVFLYPSFPLGIGLHTWPVTACGGMSIGTKSAIGAATVLTRLAQDLMTDEELRSAGRADFDARRAGKTYVSPLVDVDPTAAAPKRPAINPRMARMSWSNRWDNEGHRAARFLAGRTGTGEWRSKNAGQITVTLPRHADGVRNADRSPSSHQTAVVFLVSLACMAVGCAVSPQN